MAKRKKISRRASSAPYLRTGGASGDSAEYFLAGFAAFLLLLWMVPYWTGMGFTEYVFAKLDFAVTPTTVSAEVVLGDGRSDYVSLFESVDEYMVMRAVSPRLTAVAGANTENSTKGGENIAGMLSARFGPSGKLARFVDESLITPVSIATAEVFAGVPPRVPAGISIASFGEAAYEVLDISDQIQPMIEFYQPGVVAVWDAWLELMMDPEFN
jgi:hypothetical protein